MPEPATVPVVETLTEDHRWDALGLADIAESAAGAALARLGLDPAGYEVSCLGCNDARIAALNADFRGKPQPTNVLSWPSAERGAKRPGAMPRLPPAGTASPRPLGDVAIAYETCEAEARAAGRPLSEHATHLLVHGVLHLLGFDHERDEDAALMEGIEADVLAELGIGNPYGAQGVVPGGGP